MLIHNKNFDETLVISLPNGPVRIFTVGSAQKCVRGPSYRQQQWQKVASPIRIDEESQIVTQIYSNQRSLTRNAYEWLSKNPNHTQSETQTASELFTSYNQSVAKVRADETRFLNDRCRYKRPVGPSTSS